MATQPTTHPAASRRWLQRLALLEPFWILAVGAFLIIPPRFLPVALQLALVSYRPLLILLLLLFWPVRWLANRQLTVPTPLDWPLFLLILWLPVNYWASADKVLSWEALSYLAFGIAVYFALVNWPPACRRPQMIGWGILLIGLGLTLAAPLVTALNFTKLFQVSFLDDWLARLHAWVPGNIHPNRIAGVLILTLPLPLALFLRWDWRRWRHFEQVLYGGLTGLMLIILVLTQSRSALLAVVIAVGVVLVLRWPRLLYATPVLILLGIIVIVHFGPRSILEALSSSSALNGLDGRLEVWSRALYAIQDFPFTGIGIGTFQRVIPVLYPYFLIGPNEIVPHAHNLLLQIGVDLGLPGLIAYLAVILNTFALSIGCLRRRDPALNWALSAGATGGLIAMFIHGLFDAPLWGTKPGFLPWILVALIVRVRLSTHSNRFESSPRSPKNTVDPRPIT